MHRIGVVAGRGARFRYVLPAAALVSIAIGLSGCVAAALVPLAVEGGLLGVTTYKLVQTSTGGSVSVEFPAKDGKELPPQPLVPSKRVAIWPGDAGDVRFAEGLGNSGKFTITPPSKVSAILANAKITPDLKLLTDQEQSAAFTTVCRASSSGLVFAWRYLGENTSENTFSLSRASIAYKSELTAFSCAQRSVVWRDAVSLVVHVGEGNIPSSEEMNRIAADALVDRVLEASGFAPAAPQSASMTNEGAR